jgi:hypothetical protein
LVRQLDLGVELIRDTPAPKLLPFTRFFQGFESVPPVVSTFGSEAEQVLRELKVEFFSSRFAYMAVSHRDAHVIVSTRHLKGSDFRTLYLDLVHELFHVAQFRRGRESFLAGYTKLVQNPLSYFRNPMEIAAYRHTVEEAYRIGMTQKEVTEYLEVGWTPLNEHVRFLRSVGAEQRAGPRPERIRPPVRIARHAPITLRPFTDYFRGFESVAGVRALFGTRTEQVLNRLKVEFYSMPMGYIGLDHEGGYLSVSSPYIRDSDLSTLYLDVFFSLQSLKQFREGRLLVPYSPQWKKAMNRIAKERHLKETSVGDNPNTIEALKPTVEEARRIGMSEAEIRDYLLAPELGGMTAERHRRLLRNVGLGRAGRKR